MKKIFVSLSLLFAVSALAQITSTSLSYNSAAALINNNGTFFYNPENGDPGYTIPAGNTSSAIRFMNITMGGINANGWGIVATANETQSDFRPGPIATNFQDVTYQSRFAQSLWHVNRQTINNHQLHWSDPGYIVPMEISNWPGNGNTSNGEAAMLAPFYDADHDQLYEPEAGDYPEIRGDDAIYLIINDKKPHTTVIGNNTSFNVEIHVMFYQYASEDLILANTTFIHSSYIHRGNVLIGNLNIGSYVDFNLGNPNDDFVGCDSLRNLVYCYNGDHVDEDTPDNTGYGNNPPAIGIQLLNESLVTHNPEATTFPTHMTGLYNFLKGYTEDGQFHYDPNGQQTTLLYNNIAENGWNEIDEGNTPGDRKSILSAFYDAYYPGDVICLDMAVIFANPGDTSLRESVNNLLLVADQIQNFYHQQTYACDQVLSLDEETLPAITLYPNPADQYLTIESPYPVEISIFSTDGKRMITSDSPVNSLDISGLQPGCYFLKTADERITRFIKL